MSFRRPSFFVFPLLGVAVGALTFACGGSIDSGTQRSGDPTSPSAGSAASGGSRGVGTGVARPEPCEGDASCDYGYSRVYSCAKGADCISFTVCGETITCQADIAQCDGYPECDPGHTRVGSSSQCIQDDAVCYQRSVCGVTIWCTGPSTTDAGTPDASFPPPPPPPGP